MAEDISINGIVTVYEEQQSLHTHFLSIVNKKWSRHESLN